MLHEHFEGHVFGENRRLTGLVAVLADIGLRDARVELGHQKAALAPPLDALYEAGVGEAVLHQRDCVVFGRPQQLRKVLVLGVVLDALLLPLVDAVPVPNDKVEECVEDQNPIRGTGTHVQHDGLRGPVQRVSHQGRLNHDQRVGHVLFTYDRAEEGGLVGAAVEN